jgi:type I restriction-modification system DNA methylase subunit
MDKASARKLVEQTFRSGFDRARFSTFVREILGRYDERATQFTKGSIPDAFKPHVRGAERLGIYKSPDGEILDLLVVRLEGDTKLARARTALRNFGAYLLNRDGADAALIAFVSPDERTWRFSYVRLDLVATATRSGTVALQKELTPARRLSFLVGEGESCHTAQSRFLSLLTKVSAKPLLTDIEAAFNVEAVTEEFFEEYKELFLRTKEELDALCERDMRLRQELASRDVDTVDLAKKLLGQIVFLYFIQKKGWLGVQQGAPWGSGPSDFLRRLVQREFVSFDNFFDEVLEPLFYDSLATDRGTESLDARLRCRIPFLNGGLFEPLHGYDWRATRILLPNHLFTNNEKSPTGDTGTGVLDVFDRYNFTVNEAEPLEVEVAIDPEMLGKVFENLLEVRERKSKGSFYTPREIVHYMCEESLINYLVDSLGVGVTVDRADLEALIRTGEQAAHYEAARREGTASYSRRLPAQIETHAKTIDDALRDITVCDPAIGSGAFPVGMMTEIVRARAALTPYFDDAAERTSYHFKRHAIQASLYGVDIDPGAVEIAKLRLWLSLVVDEDDVRHIKPLPNLDYKVVPGDSLLGFPFRSARVQRIEELKARFFDATDQDVKSKLKREIDSELAHAATNSRKSLGYEVTFDFETYFSEVFNRGGFDIVIGNPPYVFGGNKGISPQAKAAYKHKYVSGANKINLFTLFIERGSQILRSRGNLIYILPNTLLRVTSYSATRQYMLEKLTVREIVDLDVGVFDKVTASTIIISLVKVPAPADAVGTTVKRGIKDPAATRVNQGEFARRGYVFDIFSSGGDRGLFAKLGKDTILLEDICSRIRFGVVISGNLDAVVSDRQRSGRWKPFLEGDEIGPFYTNYRGRFLHYDPSLLHRSRTPDIFETRKIMIQRITGGETPIKATLDDDGFYNKESILNLILSREDVPYEFILGILNSTLANWFYRRRFTNGSKLTVNLSKEYVGQIPIRLGTTTQQRAIVELVLRILDAKRRDPAANTERHSRRLDELVYDLYNLTPAEVGLVEGSE